MNNPPGQPDWSDYVHRVWIAVGAVILAVLLLAILWSGTEVLLMAFAGLLLALFFLIPADWLSQHSFLSRRWAVALVVLATIALLAAFGYNFATNVKQQFQQMMQVVPTSLSELEHQIGDWPMGSQLINALQQDQSPDQLFENWFSRVSTFFSSTLGLVVNLVVILFVGLYVAFEPDIYRRGILRLIPPAQQAAAVDLLESIIDKMSWWLLGRIVSMAVMGIFVGVGLWLLGMPMALSLGLLAALLEFIPNFGPLLAAVPALLVAYAQDQQTLYQVAILYVVVQTLESYLITPLVQRQAIEMPPALLIVAQVGLGLYAGLLGLLLAAPLTAVAMVMVERIYVQGYLGVKP